mgnify:CR=1 FL=1
MKAQIRAAALGLALALGGCGGEEGNLTKAAANLSGPRRTQFLQGGRPQFGPRRVAARLGQPIERLRQGLSGNDCPGIAQQRHEIMIVTRLAVGTRAEL